MAMLDKLDLDFVGAVPRFEIRKKSLDSWVADSLNAVGVHPFNLDNGTTTSWHGDNKLEVLQLPED